MTRFAACALALGLLCGCDRPAGNESSNIRDQVGRYRLIEAKGDYPAMIFDTATACLEPVHAITEGKNAGNLQRAGIIGQDSEACSALPVAKFKRDGDKQK